MYIYGGHNSFYPQNVKFISLTLYSGTLPTDKDDNSKAVVNG